MSAATNHSNRSQANPYLLWVAVLAAPAAWAAHLMIVYPLVHVACDVGSELSLHVVSAIALAVALIGAALCWRIWQGTGADLIESLRGRTSRTSFMAIGGFAFALMMAVGIIYAWAPIFVLDACA